MRPGGGRSVPMIRGFLGDRPAERPVIGVSKLRVVVRPVPHHPSARSVSVAPSSGRRGVRFREAGGGDVGGERSVGAHGSSFYEGQTC